MKHRAHVLLTVTFVVALAALAEAQVQSPAASRYQDEVRGLTIDQLVSMALERSRRLAAARAEVDVAQGERQQAGLRANPVIEFNQAEQAGGSDRRTAAGVSWPVELFRLPARRAAGEKQVAVAELTVVEAEWELASRVRGTSAALLTTLRSLSVLEQQGQAARELAGQIANSVGVGALPRLDRDTADVDVRRLEAAIRMAEGEAEALVAELKGLIGIEQKQTLMVRSIEIEVAAATGNTAARLTTAPAGRPDVRRAEAEGALLSAQSLVARQEGRWDLSFSAGYMRTQMSFPQSGVTPSGALAPIAGRFHEWSLGAMVTVPLRNRNQGTLATALAREKVLDAERGAIEVEAAAEQAAARARWDAARDASGQYRENVLRLATQNLEVVQQTYLAGRGTLNDVILERRRLLDLELAYTTLLGGLLSADANLRKSLGVVK